jgi:osmotically-inducible protein OsmY
MPNRQYNYQSGAQRYGSNRPSDDDDRDYGRDYGRYTENDEGDSSVRAGSYDQGRMRYGRERDTNEEIGSTGRYSGYGNFGQGDYSQSGRGYGQGNYGQPNYSMGRPSYGQEYGSSGTSDYGRSNFGSGRHDRESDYSRSGSSYGSTREGGYGGYGGQGGWREPYGEGQQYGSGQQSGWGSSSQGMHRGKGPKNYQRSDERVKEMLCERLHDDPDIDASEVTISVQGGRITLDGTVDSRRTKNAIEDVAEQIGSQDVQNNLRVQKSSERGGMDASGKSSTSSTSSTASKSSMGSEDGEQTKQKRN